MESLEVTPAGTRVSIWGEGPIWWEGKLWYVDIEGHTVCSFDPAAGEEREWDIGYRVGTIVPRAGGGFLIAGDYGIAEFDPGTGESRALPGADPEADKRPDNRFNDGKCDPAGRFWTGTISLTKKAGDANLYMLDAGRVLARVLDGITNSNGIAWSADGETMFYIDTPTKQVDAFDFEATTGEVSHRRTVIDTAASGLAGSPDGMAIDSHGHLWVAFCHAGMVAEIDPGTGAVVRTVAVPAVETTACAFGGSALDELFVTTGLKGGADEAMGGRLFVVRGLGVTGVPAVPFAG